MKDRDFCKCEKVECSYTEIGDWGCWDVCDKCKKPIEDTYTYFNHYDGEDHCCDL